jgi:hypothetical protein
MSNREDIDSLKARCAELERKNELIQRLILSWYDSFSRGNMPQPRQVTDMISDLTRL